MKGSIGVHKELSDGPTAKGGFSVFLNSLCLLDTVMGHFLLCQIVDKPPCETEKVSF